MELAEVKAAFPEIECVLFSAKDYPAIGNYAVLAAKFLRQGDDYSRGPAAAEESQGQRGLSGQTQREAPSYESFMREAEAEVALDFVSGKENPRSLELVNKTNQFNLNGIRYTPSEWHKGLQSPGSFVLTTDYKDKYGPLGIIAVLKGRAEGKTIFVDTWVMSCRAFARRIEYQCMNAMFEKFGAEEIVFELAPTKRNECLQQFFAVFQRESGLAIQDFAGTIPGKMSPALSQGGNKSMSDIRKRLAQCFTTAFPTSTNHKCILPALIRSLHGIPRRQSFSRA